ncbi:hypothetical protein ACO2KH_18615 [Leptospira terpstrae]|uniref:hypothetical protein n=1 Tax=Leptospira terpstrae TaxID=293075 RepID=UPI003D0167B5
MKSEAQFEFLKSLLSTGKHNKIYRFLISALGSTPYIGGVFGGISALWSESEQEKQNAIYESIFKITDEKVIEIEKILLNLNRKNWIAAFIKFNPINFNIIDSSNVSSITDHGNLNFSINFENEINDTFVLQYYGNKEVKINFIIESNRKIQVSLIEPLPDIIAFIFFNLK